MDVANAELKAGFVETEETRNWDSHQEPEMQVAR
jgi:hypothetical protein